MKFQQRLYTLAEYVKIMETCRRIKKFRVNCLNETDFLSTKPLEDIITNRKVDVNNTPVSWLQSREIILRKAEPYCLIMKRSLNGEEQKVDITTRLKGGPALLKNVVLPNLWPEGKPLSREKLKDLRDLLNLVPKDVKSSILL